MSDFNPEFQHEDGTPKTFQERAAYRKGQRQAQSIVHREVAEATTTDGAQHYSEGFLEYAQEQLDRAVLPAEKAAARRRLAMAKTAAKKHADEVAVADRKNKLSSNESVRLAREHAESFSRTPPPGADPIDVQTAVALAMSEDWHDPDALSKAYWEKVTAIEETALQQIESQARESNEAKAKAELDDARTQQAAAISRKRLHDAKEHLRDE